MLNELNTWKHKTVYISVLIWFALWYSVKYVPWFLIFTPLYILWEVLPYLILVFPVLFFFIKGNRLLKVITSLVSLVPLLSGILIPYILQEIKLVDTIPNNQAFVDYVDNLKFRSSEKLIINDSLLKYDKDSRTLHIKLVIDSNKMVNEINNYYKDRDSTTIPNYLMGQILYYFVQVPEGMSKLTVKPSKLICETYWDDLYIGNFNYKKYKKDYVLEGTLPQLSFGGVAVDKKWILQAGSNDTTREIPFVYIPISNQKVNLESYMRNWRS